MKPFFTFLLVLVTLTTYAQTTRPFLGWNKQKIENELKNHQDLVQDDSWVTADKEIKTISFHKKDDATSVVIFYLNKQDKCFMHSVFKSLNELPETIKKFNTIYKREDEGLWKNNTGDTSIKLEYKIGDYYFIVKYTDNL